MALLRITRTMKEQENLQERDKPMVNHPAHYNAHSIEVIDFIDDWGLSFSIGNVVKYVCRAPYKGTEMEDLEKAKWYLEHEIERIKRTNVQSP